MVHQHFTSVPAFTVAENVALAAGWPVAPGRLRERVRELASASAFRSTPTTRVERLSVGLRQRLEIVKALAADAGILLLDEPTAVLAPGRGGGSAPGDPAVHRGGGSAVLITHKLDEALAAADRVTVLRRGDGGPRPGRWPARDTATLTAAMIGEGAPDERHSSRPAPRQLRSPTDGRWCGSSRSTSGETADSASRCGVRRWSVGSGEIVGVAAVEGNGQRELLRAVAGGIHPLRGTREVAEPVAFIPEDRTTEGLIPELTLTENVVLGSPNRIRGSGAGRSTGARPARGPRRSSRSMRVAAPGPDAPAATLSGGNQQRVVVARELSRRPRVVVAENPTRGLDIRATATIHARLRRAASAGAAVLFHSSDLDEVLELADPRRGRQPRRPDPSRRRARRGKTIGALMLAGS